MEYSHSIGQVEFLNLLNLMDRPKNRSNVQPKFKRPISNQERESYLEDHLDWKIFGTLFFTIFVTITGVGIVVPLLPVYAHNLGANGFYVAMIFGAFSLSRTFFLPYFGRLSDLKGRKPFIVAGLSGYVVVSAAFIYWGSVAGLIFLRFFQGIASAMVMPVAQAYVGEISPNGREGFVMGLFNTAMFSGLSLGPVIGGVLNDHVNIDAAFVCMGAMSFAGVIFSALFLPSRRSEQITAKRPRPVSWKILLKDPIVGGLFTFRFAYTACIGIIWGFLPVFADIQFHLSSSAIAILIMLSVLISGITQVPMGYLADRFNRRGFVIWGGLIVCGAIGSLNWSTGFNYLFITCIIFGIGGGTAMPALMAMGVNYGSEKKAMGSVMALLTMAHSLGMLVGSLLAGIMMDYFELRSAFSLGAVVMILGWGGFIALMPKPPLIEKQPSHQASIETKLKESAPRVVQ